MSINASFISDTPQGSIEDLLTPRRAAFAAAEALAPGFDGFLPVKVNVSMSISRLLKETDYKHFT